MRTHLHLTEIFHADAMLTHYEDFSSFLDLTMSITPPATISAANSTIVL